jgi:hypothetical protein
MVSLEVARSRHELARRLLAHGIDPAGLKAVVGKHAFTVMMREWKANGIEAVETPRRDARSSVGSDVT